MPGDPTMLGSKKVFALYILFLIFSIRKRENKVEERGRKTERILSRFHIQQEAWCEALSHNTGIFTWARRSTDWATQPPQYILFLFSLLFYFQYC